MEKMKIKTIKLILWYCDKAIINLKNESYKEIIYDRKIHFMALNDTDCFDIYIRGENDNYCFFYKSVTSIEVLE